MAVKRPVDLSVRWNLSVRPDGAATLAFDGELDAVSTPVAWPNLQSEFARTNVVSLEIDARQLAFCDSAGLALLYYISVGGMTPGATVNLTGLSPELQHLFRSFSTEDFRALREHEPACSPFVEDVGAATGSWLRDLRQQVEFMGEVTLGVMKGLVRPRLLRWKEILRVFEVAGVNALPIVSLITFLVGMVIAFESAQPLAQLGAQVFVANLLGLVMSRELGPVMAAIMGPSSRDITRPNKLATNTCAPSWAKGCADSKAITMPTRNVINDTMGSALTPATSKTRRISFQRSRRGRTRPFMTPSVTSPMNSTCWRKSRSHEPVAAPTSSTKGEQAGSCSCKARKSSVEKLRK